MLSIPMDVWKHFPVRKTKAQKQAFRDAVQSYVTGLGYPVKLETGSHGLQNIVIGNPDSAEYLVTAHYDTPAASLLPNLVTPCNPVTFILYQLFLVGILVVVSIGVGVLVGIPTGNADVAGYVGVAVYWALLLLMRFGPANKNNANDNTSGVVTVLEIARTLPKLHRDKVCFVLFDLEEAGLVGSQSYRKVHKTATETQLVLNLDCVGDGDEIWFFPSKKLKKDQDTMARLKRCGGYFGQKKICIREKGFASYRSDHERFPRSVGIGAFHRKKGIGPYLPRIHTSRDTVLEETNVNILRACISTLISGS